MVLAVCVSLFVGTPRASWGQTVDRRSDAEATDNVLSSFAKVEQNYGRRDVESLPVDLEARVNYWDHRDGTIFVEDQHDASFVDAPRSVFRDHRTLPPGTGVRIIGDLITDGHYLRAREIEVLEQAGEPITPVRVRIDELTLGNRWSHRVETEGVVSEVLHMGHNWSAVLRSGPASFIVHRYDAVTPQYWNDLIGRRVCVVGTLSCEIDENGLPVRYNFRLNEHDPQPQPVAAAEDRPATATGSPPVTPLAELSQRPADSTAVFQTKGLVTAVRPREGYLIESGRAKQFIQSGLASQFIQGHQLSVRVVTDEHGGWRAVSADVLAEQAVPPPLSIAPWRVATEGLPARGRFEGELVASASHGRQRFLTLRDGDIDFAVVLEAEDAAWQQLQLAGARRVRVEGLAVEPPADPAEVHADARPDFVVEVSGAESIEVISRWWQFSPAVAICAMGVLATLSVAGMICFAVLWLRVQRADRTNRRLSVELLHRQKMDALGRLAGGAAHDFNNLLVGIASNLELIERDRALTSSQTRQCLDSARRCTRQATRLVRSLLGFSRRAELELRPGNLNQTVEDAVLLAQTTLGPSISVTWHPDPRLPPCRFDHAQLEQVLLNLCFNARDAIGGGDGNVNVRTEYRGGNGQPVAVITFSDDGSGMDEETRSRIFEPFFTTKAVGEGTGLGLSQAYGIIEQHGGSIECQSQPDVGTVFTITLPIVGSTQALVAADDAATTQTQPAAHRHRGRVSSDSGSAPAAGIDDVAPSQWNILLIDDDDDVRRATRLVLETLGHHVSAVATGREAIARIRRGDLPDLVVLDLLMPELPGAETFCQIKAACPELPVIVCSGLMSEVERMPELCDRTPEACLAKPFELADLRSTIDRVMRSSCSARNETSA
jgi:signal transduction histidine kinase/ActR/RegA family two-component response regulator